MRGVVEPGTQYVVSVRAFNDVDKGPVIYDLVYTASSQGALYVPTLYYLSIYRLSRVIVCSELWTQRSGMIPICLHEFPVMNTFQFQTIWSEMYVKMRRLFTSLIVIYLLLQLPILIALYTEIDYDVLFLFTKTEILANWEIMKI